MAKVEKHEIVQKIIEGLRLDAGRQVTPQEVEEKIRAVFIANESPRLILVEEATINDSNKVLTVPTGKKWKLLYGRVRLATTATVGNRVFRIDVTFSGSNCLTYIHPTTQAASLTRDYYLGNQGDAADHTSMQHVPMPVNLIIRDGDTMTIRDSASVDAAADDLTIDLVFEESNLENYEK